MKKIFFYILNLLPTQDVFAHCDIPCGIYDPHNAQMAAHTVLRMTQMLNDLKSSKDEPDFEERKKIISQLSRLTHVKEKHGELIEEELGTLENDYFKGEHFRSFPKLKGLMEKAVSLSIKTRQTIDISSCEEMTETVMEIAEIFYKTKNLTPVRVSSGYPTEGEIVTHK
ncbi:MAG: superoxide dismutase, Ni [Candidatus Levybacteria bacterium]|nr:superoxide dismutase, Ni [Candidatus Levybacteria bacterium]